METPQRRAITAATYITISRFFLVPLFLYFFIGEAYIKAMMILGLAGFTDFLDGFIARRFNMRSRLGSFLDPAADKSLMLVSFIALSRLNLIPWWLTALVIGRDTGIVIGVIVLNLMKVRLYYKPTRASKIATFSQITVLVLSLALFFLEREPSRLWWVPQNLTSQIHQIFIWIAAGATLMTCFQYSYLGYQFYRYGERKG